MKDANSNNENEDEEEEDDIIPSKKKASSRQYDKYFKSKELKLEFSQEEINKFISQTKDIDYILGINEAALKDMKPNMQAIIAYKNTLITLREREKDLQNTVEKLQKANDIYQNVKQRRQNEFMEGFNIINSKLIEMYRLLTKGGDAELELADSLDPFNEGITFTGDAKIVLQTVSKVFKSEGITDGDMATAMDLGDYLLSNGTVNKEEYCIRQEEAREILGV